MAREDGCVKGEELSCVLAKLNQEDKIHKYLKNVGIKRDLAH